MWCEAMICRGPNGERLPRAEWKPVGKGRLSITAGSGKGAAGLVAWLTKMDLDRELQLAYPMSDVKVVTHDAGLLVVGYQISAEQGLGPIIEFRQAWYCVPATQ